MIRLKRMVERTSVIMPLLLAASVTGILIGGCSEGDTAGEEGSRPAAPITARVEARRLEDTRVLRATVRASRLESIEAPRIADDALPVVTRLYVREGDEVTEGTLIGMVADTAIFVFEGQIPMYRDIVFGSTGEDVRALQAALNRLGWACGEEDGAYGEPTRACIEKFYEHSGVPFATVGTRRDVREVEQLLDEVKSYPRGTRRTQLIEDLNDDLARLTAPKIAIGEFVFIPQLPSRVYSIDSEIGTQVHQSLLSLGDIDLDLSARVTEYQAQIIQTGMVAVFDDPSVDLHADTTVLDIREYSTQGDEGSGTTVTELPYEIVFDSSKVKDLETLIGQSIRVVVTISGTPNTSLVVPLTAVYTSPEGDTYVDKVDSEGRTTRVVVSLGLLAGGYVEILNAEPPGLNVGESVLVGFIYAHAE